MNGSCPSKQSRGMGPNSQRLLVLQTSGLWVGTRWPASSIVVEIRVSTELALLALAILDTWNLVLVGAFFVPIIQSS